jgi:hypothetical protein
MTHPDADHLVLLAYGELPPAEGAALEAHLAACAPCRDAFARLERARVAVEWALPSRRRRFPGLVTLGLAAAAVVAVVLLARPEPVRDAERVWQPFAPWSAHAGYLAGGAPVREIDAQLTRLEQERPYGFPN